MVAWLASYCFAVNLFWQGTMIRVCSGLCAHTFLGGERGAVVLVVKWLSNFHVALYFDCVYTSSAYTPRVSHVMLSKWFSGFFFFHETSSSWKLPKRTQAFQVDVCRPYQNSVGVHKKLQLDLKVFIFWIPCTVLDLFPPKHAYRQCFLCWQFFFVCN